MFAEVAFPIRSFQTFTYSIPNEHAREIHVGIRVYVPFRNKTIQGVVVNIKNTNSFKGPLKKIIKPIDKFGNIEDRKVQSTDIEENLTQWIRIWSSNHPDY